MPRDPRPSRAAPIVSFADAGAFETWLELHGDEPEGVWLAIAKQGSGIASITSDEAVDVGLCFGFISGQRKALDAQHYLQKYVPRRARSRWSRVNVEKVEALAGAGRMRPGGLAEVAAAKADGRWEAAYASQREATTPDDLVAALAISPRAAATFDALGKTRRYRCILQLLTIRDPGRRAARVTRVIEALASGDVARL